MCPAPARERLENCIPEGCRKIRQADDLHKRQRKRKSGQGGKVAQRRGYHPTLGKTEYSKRQAV